MVSLGYESAGRISQGRNEADARSTASRNGRESEKVESDAFSEYDVSIK